MLNNATITVFAIPSFDRWHCPSTVINHPSLFVRWLGVRLVGHLLSLC